MINVRNITNKARIIFQDLKFRWLFIGGVAIFSLVFISLVFPPTNAQTPSNKEIRIDAGMGLSEIASLLQKEELIRSPLLFKVIALATLKANRLRPGKYLIPDKSSYRALLNILVRGGNEEVTIVVPEGATIFDIDALLTDSGVIKAGELLIYDKKQLQSYEGYLFPDTYRFLLGSDVEIVVTKMLKTFKEKTAPFFTGSERDRYETLILASLLEKEIPEFKDRELVAGILKKRLLNNWPLQVDATVCYVKKPAKCYPLQAIDFKINSPYNTYVNQGLPPTPIGNPGLKAIQAALSPKDSSNWYYISDPKTRKTIYARTLDEQALNRARYLR